MKAENTICFKIGEAQDIVQKAVSTGNFDALTLTNLLHEIKTAAQHMEDGLKARKKLLMEAGLEQAYQNRKAIEGRIEGINTIANTKKQTPEKVNFEVRIKENGEVVYERSSFAGVVSLVEKIEDMDKDGVITGQTQKFYFGKDLSFWFAFDQLMQGMDEHKARILLGLQIAIRKLASPETKAELLRRLNN